MTTPDLFTGGNGENGGIGILSPLSLFSPVKPVWKRLVPLFSLALASGVQLTATPSPDQVRTFEQTLRSATTRHLDALLASPESLKNLKGKSADAMTALAFELTAEATRKPTYHAAALQLADQIQAAMRATKFGVLYIKEKTKDTGEDISGGGPPAFGWYTSALAYIYHHERGRRDDLIYVGTVLDRFPWNEEGWWSADIDIKTGISKQPMTKPAQPNKNASVAMAAALTADYLREIDAPLAARLAHKAERALEAHLAPKQEANGFWHYGGTGRDPKEKDVHGYFMLTVCELLQWRALETTPSRPTLSRLLTKAGEFANSTLAPITDPNTGKTTPPNHGTPAHYTIADEPKRGFQLATALIGTGHLDLGIPIAEHTLKYFPYSDRGMEAAQAVYYSALMQRMLRERSP